jgi:hypothetical protein
MEISFDIRGNLKPHGKINLTLDEFKKSFVDGFVPQNQRRLEIFSHYMQFIQQFKQEVSQDFIHWIDGSFVTKKTDPRDIDFVTLIDYRTYEKHETTIENKFRGQAAKDLFGLVDAYVIKMYPLGHARRWVSEYDLVYWRRWFGETKMNRAKKKFKKGFIELNFGDN